MASTSNTTAQTSLPSHGIPNDPGFCSALDPALRQIRYVDLHPGSIKDSLVCSLGYTTLDPDAKKQMTYEALSYCWGESDPSDLVTIELRVPDMKIDKALGENVIAPWPKSSSRLTKLFSSSRIKHAMKSVGTEPSTSSFKITRNLEAALRVLRLPEAERTLWIDAICINQMDNNEKSHQIGHMNLIYASAKEVIVWLGPADLESNIVFRCHELLEDELQSHVGASYLPSKAATTKFKGGLFKEDWESVGRKFGLSMSEDRRVQKKTQSKMGVSLGSLSPLSLSSYRPPFLSSFEKFLNRPWFRRIWVYPEVLLAPRVKDGNHLVTIVAGNSTMRWLSLIELVRAIEEFSYTNRYFKQGQGENLTWFRNSWYWPTTGSQSYSDLTLTEYFWRTRKFEASDPRDKIFALLHVARDTRERIHSDPRILPDYEKSLEEIVLNYQNIGIMLS